MPLKKLQELLDSKHVKYQVISHSPAYTAQQVAQTTHISGWEMAKSVMLKIDGRYVMFVLPASTKVNFDAIKKQAKAKKVELATEYEFKNLFPDCEVGAMPPFGNLYGVDVLVSKDIAKNKQIAFNSGSHSEVIKLAYKDFENLVHPKLLEAA